MDFVRNFPLFAIMLCLAGGVTCCVMPSRISRRFIIALDALLTAMMLCLLSYTVKNGESFVYYMGHFPAPWGNEIRIGPLEALMASVLSGVMTLTLASGMEHILSDCEKEKVSLYFTVSSLLLASLLALVFTNDLFTGYVFVEINTIASCALVMFRYKSGKALTATARYLIMSLLGSGLFLMGIVILYGISGHLLMEPIKGKVSELAATGEYALPLAVITVLFSAGMALKSALWPFHAWLPDAHGSATSASSGILSGLVLKGYIILLIKIYYRVIGLDVVAASGVGNAMFAFGIGAMIFGSLSAIRERDIKRMLAWSSVAQIGYIYAGIGLGTEAGMAAACVQIAVHAVTKPMLFASAGGLMTVSGESRSFTALEGAGRRDPVSGVAFFTGALSMIGIPLFAGFTTKLSLATASASMLGVKGIICLAAIAVSTVLNAVYYIPVIALLFKKAGEDASKMGRYPHGAGYVAAIVLFIVLNFFLGLCSDGLLHIISAGLELFA